MTTGRSSLTSVSVLSYSGTSEFTPIIDDDIEDAFKPIRIKPISPISYVVEEVKKVDLPSSFLELRRTISPPGTTTVRGSIRGKFICTPR